MKQQPKAFLEGLEMLEAFARGNGYRLIGTFCLTKGDDNAWIQQIDSNQTK